MKRNRCIAVHLVGVDLLIDPKPPLEGRWHGEAMTERCWGSCDFHKFSAQRTAVTPLSRAARASSPQGEPFAARFHKPSANRRCGTDAQMCTYVTLDTMRAPTYSLFTITYSLTKKNRSAFTDRFFFVLALPIFPCSRPQSIVGEGELNFCVRDGNRWTLTPINTNCVEANSVSFASV